MSRHFSLAILGGLLLIGQASDVFAHAFHITVAEAEVNHKTGQIEIAMRVHPGDLEVALGRMTNRRIRLEKEPKIDALITDYLQRSIQLKAAPSQTKSSNTKQTKAQTDRKPTSAKKSQSPKIKWVGKDVSVKWAWLYFEIPAVKELNGATFTNRVFHEILANQENTIILKDGKRKQTIMCRKDKATVTINLRPPVKKP